uniref:Uncharacterized protein n=1 Tax=Sphaerodactylus townsendi TaxID=933632 RepID=A0ACB8F2G6_9SAUR
MVVAEHKLLTKPHISVQATGNQRVYENEAGGRQASSCVSGLVPSPDSNFRVTVRCSYSAEASLPVSVLSCPTDATCWHCPARTSHTGDEIGARCISTAVPQPVYLQGRRDASSVVRGPPPGRRQRTAGDYPEEQLVLVTLDGLCELFLAPRDPEVLSYQGLKRIPQDSPVQWDGAVILAAGIATVVAVGGLVAVVLRNHQRRQEKR